MKRSIPSQIRSVFNISDPTATVFNDIVCVEECSYVDNRKTISAEIHSYLNNRHSFTNDFRKSNWNSPGILSYVNDSSIFDVRCASEQTETCILKDGSLRSSADILKMEYLDIQKYTFYNNNAMHFTASLNNVNQPELKTNVVHTSNVFMTYSDYDIATQLAKKSDCFNISMLSTNSINRSCERVFRHTALVNYEIKDTTAKSDTHSSQDDIFIADNTQEEISSREEMFMQLPVIIIPDSQESSSQEERNVITTVHNEVLSDNYQLSPDIF